MKQPILSLENVTKIYTGSRGTVRALDGVTLDIQQGEIFGLLGVNGAGKTTLSSILATLHPATAGSILFKGESIYTNIERYRKALGFCPQTQNLDLSLNVQENLIFAGKYFLLSKETIAERVRILMDKLELTKYKDFQINALSGGTKQRVLIARALMHNPEIVILDEPTVGLDPDIRRKLWQIIKDLKNDGITVILTTHYLDEAEELADRVCFLQQGKVNIIETVSKLREAHQMASLEDIFIRLTNATHKK
jgi:ABC-2 type transport system ATP-binding protein